MDYDTLARDYAQHRHIHPGVLAELMKKGLLNAASKVLEVGCGTGNYIVAIKDATGCNCRGIDPSMQMLAKARMSNQYIKFSQGKAEKLEFRPDAFDLVFSVDVIHHVCDRPAYYGETLRVLKPGGRVCTVTDSEGIIRNRQPLANYFPETVDPEVKRYPRIPDLYQMMTEAGFKEISEDCVENQTTIQNIQAYRDKAFSSLYLISQEAFERGIQRMEKDSLAGPIRCISRYLLLWGVKP